MKSSLSVATTINPRFDHVSPIEGLRSEVTITHRCQVFAELMAVARSGLVDILLIADDFDMVGLEALQQLLQHDPHGPKIAAISDVADDRQRLAALGISVASPHLAGAELVQWLRDVAENGVISGDAHGPVHTEDLEVLERLDSDAQPPRPAGRRAAPYDPASDIVPTDEISESDSDVRNFRVEDTAEAAERPVADEAEARDTESSIGQLIAVWGPIGSPGVTTVAVNMAVESALMGQRTLLIDADTYGAAVATHVGLLDDAAAIAQACRAAEHRRLDATQLAQFAQRVTLERGALDIMTGLTRPERWPQLRTTAWEHILDSARQGWDQVIIDCGFGLEQDEELSFDIPAPQRNATTIAAVTKADTVIAVGTGDPVGFVRFMKGIEHLTELTTSRVIPVLNKVTSMTSGIGPKRQLATVWDRFGPKTPLHHFLPWAPEVTAAALFEAKTLAERAPKAELRIGIRGLMQACLPVHAVVRSTQAGARNTSTNSGGVLRTAMTQVKERLTRG